MVALQYFNLLFSSFGWLWNVYVWTVLWIRDFSFVELKAELDIKIEFLEDFFYAFYSVSDIVYYLLFPRAIKLNQILIKKSQINKKCWMNLKIKKKKKKMNW